MPILVKAMQEQQEIIEDLKIRITKLEKLIIKQKQNGNYLQMGHPTNERSHSGRG